MLKRVATLAEKATLVKLTQRKPALVKRDQNLSAALQLQEGDRSITVHRKLFKDKHSPIHRIMQAAGEVYAYHKQHTHPYLDGGTRLLPNALYFEYTQEMKHRIAKVERLLDLHMPDYDQLVADDMAYRGASAALTDYPTAAEFRACMTNTVRPVPLPDKRHFLFDLTDEDMAEFERAEEEAAQLVATNTVQTMLKPVSDLLAKLEDYRGEQGQRWHNSVVQNVIDSCELARKIAIHPSDELLGYINELEQLARGYLANVEVLKGSANARADAQAALQAAAKKFEGYF